MNSLAIAPRRAPTIDLTRATTRRLVHCLRIADERSLDKTRAVPFDEIAARCPVAPSSEMVQSTGWSSLQNHDIVPISVGQAGIPAETQPGNQKQYLPYCLLTYDKPANWRGDRMETTLLLVTTGFRWRHDSGSGTAKAP